MRDDVDIRSPHMFGLIWFKDICFDVVDFGPQDIKTSDKYWYIIIIIVCLQAIEFKASQPTPLRYTPRNRALLRAH